ncbi:MAG TPA: alpha/beta hydrolase, partial [Usitatibacteraceae bacterium]|nr:alpha/beta hydrolase [Usitatibacteraceae bacterium]
MPVLAVLAVALAACAPAPSGPAKTIALSECRLPGIETTVLCGRHEVFEDRAAKSGRKIALRIAVLPARRRAGDPDPVVVLAGGPGQGAVALAPHVRRLFDRLANTRDIVLVDQRGTGESGALKCDDGRAAGAEALFEGGVPETLVRDCLSKLDADPRHYATPSATADLDEVLTGLGYRQVNLWGGSYGTRAALDFIRRHPARVRSAVLDGVAPPDMKLPLSFVQDGEAALSRLFDACEAQAPCREAYPALRETVSGLRASLARKPVAATLRDPVTGEAFERALADYPKIGKPGSFPVFTQKPGPGLRAVLDALEGDDFREAVERKFGIDLSGKPTMTTLRSRARARDGQIHLDSKTKVVTVLVYLNRASDAFESHAGC